MKDRLRDQKGFSLVELVIAMVIAALLVAASVAAWFQLTTVSARNSDYMAAYNQVQNAGYWFSRDAVQVQEFPYDDPETTETVEFDNPDTTDVEEFLTLRWHEWDGIRYDVVYTLDEASGELRRSYSINGGSVENFIVAHYIDSDNTSCAWEVDEDVLALEMTAQFGDRSATRTYKVEPRSLS